jgi:electron transfer flavoprotein alpha subunit
MSNNVLVIAEQRGGALKKVSLEMLGEAGRIATALGGQAEAAVLGAGVTGLAETLARHGARKVYVGDDAMLARYSPDGYATILANLVKATDPAIVLAPATFFGRDLAPRVAAKLGAGLASDCTGFEVQDGGRLLITRPIYAGKAIARVRVTTRPQMATVRPNTFPVPEANPGANAVTEPVSLDGYQAWAVVTGLTAAAGGKLDVAEANIIVSGGRGMADPANYRILEEMAAVLGAAVGASRAAVDAGWRPHADQVGQTGKTVSPDLYIACGISGAIQHLAGMKTSKVIVAINKDPDAPIFKLADYGIVGDLFKVVPVLTEEFRKLKAE